MVTARPPRPPAEPAPTWQPIGRLPLVATIIDGMLADDRQITVTLLEARPRPSVLDDATIARVRRVPTRRRARTRAAVLGSRQGARLGRRVAAPPGPSASARCARASCQPSTT